MSLIRESCPFYVVPLVVWASALLTTSHGGALVRMSRSHAALLTGEQGFDHGA